MGFDTLASVIHNTLLTTEGETVFYNSIPLSIVASVSALQAESEHEVSNDFGALVKIQSKDFLISVEALNDAGITQIFRGDEITANGKVYSVAPITGSEEYFEFSDHKETHYRIHTKYIKVAV